MKKVCLAFVLCLCLVLPTFASCSALPFDSFGELLGFAETETDRPSVTDAPYVFEFKDAGEGKCVISNIVFDEEYTQAITVEFPNVSPDGKEVLGVEFRSEADILPGMIRGEEMDKIFDTLEENIEAAINEGRIDDPENERYRLDKFKAWYTKFSLENAKGETYDRYLEDFPVLAVTDEIYALDVNIGTKDRMKQNAFMLEYGITIEDIRAANDKLYYEIQNSDAANKEELLGCVPDNQRVCYPRNVKELVFEDIKYDFCGTYVFYGNGIDVTVSLDDSLVSIDDMAFYGCSSLRKITIPAGVTRIGDMAFCGCSGLMTIDYTGTREQWNAVSRGSDWNYGAGDYTIYCTYENKSK